MKTCFKCREKKSLAEFYKHGGMSDGHLNKCKVCAIKDSTRDRVTNREKARELDRTRGILKQAQGDAAIRDYFAAKAMQGMLTDIPKALCGMDWQENVAKASYEIADAMLEARKK